MRNFLQKVKFRWRLAPTYIKVLDISCWVFLLFIIVNLG